MNVPVKISLVIAGYVAAFFAAGAVTALYVASMAGTDRGSDGMTAFGDSLLFLAALGVASLPATGAALYFLRPWRAFWIGLSVLALLSAASGVLAAIVYAIGTTTGGTGILQQWANFAVLRILIAPLFALAFLLSGLIAPTGRLRALLLSATAVETLAFSCIVLSWIHHNASP